MWTFLNIIRWKFEQNITKSQNIFTFVLRYTLNLEQNIYRSSFGTCSGRKLFQMVKWIYQTLILSLKNCWTKKLDKTTWKNYTDDPEIFETCTCPLHFGHEGLKTGSDTIITFFESFIHNFSNHFQQPSTSWRLLSTRWV